MEQGDKIVFYPKGKKHGKKFDATVFRVFLDAVLIQCNGSVYCVKQANKNNYIE
jgi:hypothetical protein